MVIVGRSLWNGPKSQWDVPSSICANRTCAGFSSMKGQYGLDRGLIAGEVLRMLRCSHSGRGIEHPDDLQVSLSKNIPLDCDPRSIFKISCCLQRRSARSTFDSTWTRAVASTSRISWRSRESLGLPEVPEVRAAPAILLPLVKSPRSFARNFSPRDPNAPHVRAGVYGQICFVGYLNG